MRYINLLTYLLIRANCCRGIQAIPIARSLLAGTEERDDDGMTGAPLRRVGVVRAARDVDETHVVRRGRRVHLPATLPPAQRRPLSLRRLPALPQSRPVPRQQGPRAPRLIPSYVIYISCLSLIHI